MNITAKYIAITSAFLLAQPVITSAHMPIYGKMLPMRRQPSRMRSMMRLIKWRACNRVSRNLAVS